MLEEQDNNPEKLESSMVNRQWLLADLQKNPSIAEQSTNQIEETKRKQTELEAETAANVTSNKEIAVICLGSILVLVCLAGPILLIFGPASMTINILLFMLLSEFVLILMIGLLNEPKGGASRTRDNQADLMDPEFDYSFCQDHHY